MLTLVVIVFQVMVVMAFLNFKMLRRLPVLSWRMPLNKCGRKDGNSCIELQEY